MPFIQVRDLETYYELAGSGPRLLFISGTGSDLRAKPNIFDAPIARQFELLAYDQCALGRTDRPSAAPSMADYADDAGALLAALGWDRCGVLGVSFGGMVAQELALRHPARVERLVLACTSSGGAGGASYPLHDVAHLAPEQRARRMLPVNDTRMADLEQRDPERYQRLIQMAIDQAKVGAGDPGRAEGQLMQLEARRGHDTFDRLPELRLPVLICAGRYDAIAPLSNSEALHARIVGSELAIFEGGHLFMIQDKAAFPKMAEFLFDGASPDMQHLVRE